MQHVRDRGQYLGVKIKIVGSLEAIWKLVSQRSELGGVRFLSRIHRHRHVESVAKPEGSSQLSIPVGF